MSDCRPTEEWINPPRVYSQQDVDELKVKYGWHTGTPTEEGDYICAFRMCDGSIEYGWCNWNNGAWDILCDNDPLNGTCELVAWQKIEPYRG